ncbi:MAG TPA: hypothetical protein VFJ85_04590 [Acidimicrobiales bacterium]|nr:hypothetical protein [Acidimicrobiales bacterium]
MLRKRTVVTALSLSALALGLSVSPAFGADAKSQVTPGSSDQAVLQAEANARFAARPAPGAAAALAALQGRIGHFVQANGTRHSFASFIDSNTGRIVLKTNAPGQVVASLVGADKGLVDVQASATQDLYSRKSDTQAYWGGAGITASVGTPWCSSGFAVKNGAGTRFMVTAGHCFSTGQNVYTELGGAYYGTVGVRGLASGFDMEQIGGASYWSYIYTGGTNSSTGLPVVGAGDPVVGYSNYCHSGRTTGENCGHTAQSNFAQVCTQTGCKYPVIAFTGGNLPQGGDSGSPFYVKDSSSSWIRGMVIAGDGTTSYAEKYSRISSYLGATAVTQ